MELEPITRVPVPGGIVHTLPYADHTTVSLHVDGAPIAEWWQVEIYQGQQTPEQYQARIVAAQEIGTRMLAAFWVWKPELSAF